MIVYLEQNSTFIEDVFTNRIEEKILSSVQSKLGRSVGKSEIQSWKNSLPIMERVMSDPSIPYDAGIAIEFSIPSTNKRIDFIVTGYNERNVRTAIIVELKQWSDVMKTDKDAIVATWIGGSEREVIHPSCQAWSYATLIEDYNEDVREMPINLWPCAYLHNCDQVEVVQARHYHHHLEKAPAFLKDDATKLRDFIRSHVRRGDQGGAMYFIAEGKISPSKGLVDHLSSLLKGNPEFKLIDDQKVVYETALAASVRNSDEIKQVVIVNGGPGTGKSVVAINLLVETTKRGCISKYVTKNSAPRAVYEARLVGSMTKSRISSLFVGSGGFIDVDTNTFDVLIVDEAHRLNEKSGLFMNLGENQIEEIINCARTSVFFLDEGQRVHWNDIGTKEEIVHWAQQHRANVIEVDLESQFRCAGSDGYIAWVDSALQIRDTANETFNIDSYDVQVCRSAVELRDIIFEKNCHQNSARLVAGYCWDWKSKKDANADDIILDDGKFKAKWNLTKDGSLWLISKNSVTEVGCIHTCQGLELDYIGVIIGPDLVVRDGTIVTNAKKRSSSDSSIRGYGTLYRSNPQAALSKADLIIKNTYRTLMTRGRKACFLYATDEETNEYFSNLLSRI